MNKHFNSSGVTRVGDTRGGNWGCHPTILSWKTWRLFIVASSAVWPFYCSWLYRLLLLSLGCHPYPGVTPHLFYLSDLVSPLFFVNLPTNFFPSGVTPLKGVTRGGPSPPPSPTLVTPLFNSELFTGFVPVRQETFPWQQFQLDQTRNLP